MNTQTAPERINNVWVRCPICDGTDMRLEGGVINCVNLECRLNGGDNYDGLANKHPTLQPQAQPVAPDALREADLVHDIQIQNAQLTEKSIRIAQLERLFNKILDDDTGDYDFIKFTIREALATPAQPVAAPSQDAWMPIDTAPRGIPIHTCGTFKPTPGREIEDSYIVLRDDELSATSPHWTMRGHHEHDGIIGLYIRTHWVARQELPSLPAAYSTREM